MGRLGLVLIAVGIGLQVLADEPFDYFDNSWSVIGLKDYARGTRITPLNKLMIGTTAGTDEKEAEKASVQIRFGRELELLSRKQVKQLAEGWLPVVALQANDGPMRYSFGFWATPLPTVRNWAKAFDGPSEGENFLNWVWVQIENTGALPLEAKVKVEQCGPYEKGKHPVPSLGTPREFSQTIQGKKSAEFVVAIPWEPVAEDFSNDVAQIWLERTFGYWQVLMKDAALIEVPCEKAAQAYKAAHVCQLIAGDHGELHGGEGFYDEFYIRDGAYQVMELEEAGLWDAARNMIEVYLKHQRDDGRFESQKNQFDANGQALWALWQYWRITGDQAWIERVYPQMQKSCEWIAQARLSNAEGPFAGLLPNAPADGEYLWDGNHHIAGYDFWNLRGLLCTADAAKALGKQDEADLWTKEAEAYRKAIDAAWERTGLSHFPPSWEKEGTHWGNTETLWPTPVFGADDARVAALMDEVRTRHCGGFVEGTIRWTPGKGENAIHPYMSAYTTMASLARGEDEKVVEEFYWYLLHSTATHAFPEGIFYERRFAWSNTIPHVTGASNYALMLRHMLVHEEGDELHLLKAVPDWWLEEGKAIRVKSAPTHFGVVNLEVQGTAQGVQVKFEPSWRNAPSKVVLHLPESRPVENAEGMEVVKRPGQKERWDFEGVVKRYEGMKK